MCGIVGIYNHTEAANLAYLCLHAQQHRGQESAGIVTSDEANLHSFKGMGWVSEVVNGSVLGGLPGRFAIGHCRYSTAGVSDLKNAQPFLMGYAGGEIAIGHNGNLTNAITLRKKLEAEGAIFQSTMDTEVIVHLVARSTCNTLEDRVIEALKLIRGAWCLVFLTQDTMIVARDPHGFRPLVLGKLNGAHIAVSESCALDLIGAEFVREVEPGEILVCRGENLHSLKPFGKQPRAHCIFEYIYFARPDSFLFGREVYDIRRGYGRQLAREQPAEADVVIAVPDSGVPAAIGYAEEAGIAFQMGLIRSHYVGRTFIEPENSIRHFGVKLKLNPVREVLHGKRVVVVDDSIVRGTTSMKIVKMLRERGGAREVHLRISSPPIAWPCFYGIDTPTREELIASNQNVEEIRKFITADSLGYLSWEGLRWFKPKQREENFCDACFTGNYQVGLTDTPEIEGLAREFYSRRGGRGPKS